MKKQTNQRRQTILLAAIVTIFLLGAFDSTFAQGVGKRFNSRDPRPCVKTKATGIKPTVAEAVAAVICSGEGERSDLLYFVDDVKIMSFGKGQRPNPKDYYTPAADLNSLEYEIRGSLKSYQCGVPRPDQSGRTCYLYDEANAEGSCYKNTFGEWFCAMHDKTLNLRNDYTEVVPPGGAKAAANNAPVKDKPAAKNGNQTADRQADADENGFVKPDFSEMEEYFEIVRYEYDIAEQTLKVVLKMTKQTNVCDWEINFYDADGVRVFRKGYFVGNDTCSPELGEPSKAYASMPTEKQMKEVKKVAITRHIY